MKHPIAVISVLLFAYSVAMVTFLFLSNYDRWCATPEVGGNHLLQPFCPKDSK
jgi:hypothetical protein